MKKVVLALVALLTMASAPAQESEKKELGQPQGKEMLKSGKGKMKAVREMTPEQRTERMAKRLKLTDEQKAQVLALNTEYADVLKGPRMRGPRPPKKPVTDGVTGATEQQPQPQAQSEQQAQPEQRPERRQMTDEQRAQMRQHSEQRKEYDKKLQQILTKEQYQEYQKMRPGRHGHKGHKGGHPDKKEAKD